jgi:hypothetical protein
VTKDWRISYEPYLTKQLKGLGVSAAWIRHARGANLASLDLLYVAVRDIRKMIASLAVATEPLLKRVSLYFDTSDPRCESVDAAHHVYRVGVINKTGRSLSPVWLRVVRTWPQDSGTWGRPLQERDDTLVHGEFPATKAGVTVNPGGNQPSRFFNVVEKFYKDVPDPRFTEPHRYLDHVYVSIATDAGRHSSCIIRDDRIKGIRLRLDTPIGAVERDFSVRVVNGRLFLALA